MAALMTSSTAVHQPRPTPQRPRHLRLVEDGHRADGTVRSAQPPYLRRRLAVLLAATTVVVGVVGVAAPVLHADPVDPAAGASTHVVAPGDTLWDIASGLRPAADPRGVVADILSLNASAGVEVDPGGLRVGQRVLLPGE